MMIATLPANGQELLNLAGLNGLLEEAVEYYKSSAPTVAAYLDDLYQRIPAGAVTLRELSQVLRLRENGQWEYPTFAANRIYKLESSLGRDTTGHTGF